MKKILLISIVCFCIGGLFGLKTATPKAEASVYDTLKQLNSIEIKLYSKHPIKALKAKSYATQAEKATEKNWDAYTTWQGNGDAFRHAYWSALMAYRIDQNFAYEAGLAHEGLKKGYNAKKLNADTKMDVANNASGRSIAKKIGKYQSDSTICKNVMTAVCKGKLKRIRSYTSKRKGKNVTKIAGVYTLYEGYYIKTTSGGKKK